MGNPRDFLILASKELGEVPELVVEDFLESDYVQLVEQDLVASTARGANNAGTAAGTSSSTRSCSTSWT
jgi:hypothetical protein